VRFLVDECCDAIVGRTLRELGHDAVDIVQAARGSFDFAILSRAKDEARILITEDNDFGELILRHGHDSAGCILLRLPSGIRL
jgi:predicted nuclease of predicted toxin-antitoxin system